MSRLSPNLDKLKALHHLKRDAGLAQLISIVANDTDLDLALPVQVNNCLKSGFIPSESRSLQQKAEEFCRKTRVIANKCKVFVGNVSYRVKSRELKEFFGYFGKVIHAEIITNRMNKRSRGFGFVTFSNEWEANKAKNSSDEERTLEGRIMKVCSPERKKKGSKGFAQEPTLKEALEFFTENGGSNQELGDVTMEDTAIKQNLNDPKSVSPILKLNEYTMLHIFCYLSPKDRIRVERVCRQWRLLAIKSWHHITHLDFKGAFTAFKGAGGLTDEILWSILRRGCQNLKSLDLSLSPHFLTEFAILCIAKKCKTLKELNISGVDVGTSSIKALSISCTQLEKVTIQKCFRLGEKGLWWLFKNCKKLCSINLEGKQSLKGQCFFMLPPTCKSLHLKDCTQLTDRGMGYIGDKCKDLKAINISGCITLTDEGILQLTQKCCMIESLQFSQAGNNVTVHGLRGIENLSLLKDLDLSKNAVVNDELLYRIGRNCIHLRSLNLDSCHGGVTDTGLQCLVSCYQLSSLVISYLDKITDEGLVPMCANGSLEKLEARACTALTDKSIECLLKHCHDLAAVDVSGCSSITNVSLELLTRYCSLEDRPFLICTLGGTAIDGEEISRVQQTLQRCQLSSSDYSISERFDAVPTHGSGAFYCEDEDDDDEFDEYDNFADEDEEHFHNVVDEDETWMAEDSLWWRPDDGDAIDFLEADYPSLLEEQMYRS